MRLGELTWRWRPPRDYAKKSGASPIEIDPVAIDRFTRLTREQLISGDVAARKAYRASIVDAVIVSEDKIRIIGSNDNPVDIRSQGPTHASGS